MIGPWIKNAVKTVASVVTAKAVFSISATVVKIRSIFGGANRATVYYAGFDVVAGLYFIMP